MKTCARLTGGIALILAKLADASPLETPDKGSPLRRAILDRLRASRPMQSFWIPANLSPKLPAIPSATYVREDPKLLQRSVRLFPSRRTHEVRYFSSPLSVP